MRIVEGRQPFHRAGFLGHDEKNSRRMERVELVLDNMNVNYVSWERRTDGKFEHVGNAGERLLTEKSYSLCLEKRDGKGLAGVLMDGIRWDSLEPIEIALPKRLLVGVATDQNTSSGFEVPFWQVRLFRVAAK